MHPTRAFLLTAAAALAGCASSPSIRVRPPSLALPDLFAPVAWTTTCEGLSQALGAPVGRLRGGRGCTAPVTRAPLGDAELRLEFRAGPDRFTSVALTRRDAPPCAGERPRPAGCGDDPTFDLTVAFDLVRRALEARLGPPLATLAEGRDRAAEWRPAGYTLTAGLYGPKRDRGWRVVVDAVPSAVDAAGRPLLPDELVTR